MGYLDWRVYGVEAPLALSGRDHSLHDDTADIAERRSIVGGWLLTPFGARAALVMAITGVLAVVAGVFAITSALPHLNPYKVELSIGFVILITLANLRGVRESGTLFALPTYGFIVSIYILVATGLFHCLTNGCAQAKLPTQGPLLPVGTAAGDFTPAAADAPPGREPAGCRRSTSGTPRAGSGSPAAARPGRDRPGS